MGVGRAAVRRLVAAAVSTALVMTAIGVANGGTSAWIEHLPAAPASVAATTVPWYDALDASANVRLASDASVSLDVSLRWRLDALEYLARAAGDASDLALHANALATRTWQFDQIEHVGGRCEASWRAAQADLIERYLQEHGTTHDVLTATELGIMRALLLRDAGSSLDADRIRSCRLDAHLMVLELASDHPQLLLEDVERRLGERSSRLMHSAPPPSLWLHTDLGRDPFGVRANVRVGIDVPLPNAIGASELTLASDGRGSEVGLRWMHAAGSGRREPHPPPVPSTADTRNSLAATLWQLRLQAELRRVDASRRWAHACGSDDASAIDRCMRGLPFDASHLDALLAAADVELVVLQTTLAAIEASGHPLVRLLEGR